MVFGVRQVLIL